MLTPFDAQTDTGLLIGHRRTAPAAPLIRLPRPVVLGGTDALAFAASAAVVAAVVHWLGRDAAQAVAGVLPLSAAAMASVMLGLALRGHYGMHPLQADGARDLVLGAAAALVISGFLAFMLRLDAGRWELAGLWLAFVPAALASRHAARTALHRAGAWQRRLVVVGDGEALTHALGLLREEFGRDWALTGVLHPAQIGPLEHGRWAGVLRQHEADMVVLAMDDLPREYTDWLARDRVAFAVVPRVSGLPVHGGRQSRHLSHDAVLWAYRDNLRTPVARAAKAALDRAGAAAMILVMTPVLLAIALAIKLDGGPALYRHRRVGAGGRPFHCLKFRSMVRESDQVLRRVLDEDPAAAAEWASARKLRRDPRVTAIGQFLRSSSLDELPQLFNVLCGDMSLVGPRPIVQAEVTRYGDDIHHYYAARPGLTGLWQVSGRSDTGYGQRVQLDTWYVKNWSFWTDVSILLRTVPAVLKRRGAV